MEAPKRARRRRPPKATDASGSIDVPAIAAVADAYAHV